MHRQKIIQSAERIVVKLGTAVLMKEEGGVALSRFYSFVEGIAELMKAGKEVILVTSGAVGLGVKKLGLAKKPKHLPQKQACAAVGQGRLMAMYSDAFDVLGITTAQVLLTEEDFSNRRRYLNLRSTLTQLIEMGVLPIINENDTVSTAELETLKSDGPVKVSFGDNDLLIILTDVEGLYTEDPRKNTQAALIPLVESITPEIEALAGGTAGNTGRGGMRTKLEAARVATQSGCAAIIAGGKVPSVIPSLFAGQELGTLFVSKLGLSGKKRWIAFATTVRAAIVLNDGACSALSSKKASLLAAGIVELKGQFERGDVVAIFDSHGHEFARGIVNYASAEVEKILGKHSDAITDKIEDRNYDAIITRDNIALLEAVSSGDNK